MSQASGPGGRTPTVHIELGNTAYGRHEAEKKKDVVQVIEKMTLEERVAILQQMVEMDAANVADDETAPPSLTPI
jgi:hypothetical protein